MGTNALPTNIGDLTKLGNKMVGGLAALGQSLGITQLTAASLQAQLDAFATAQAQFNGAREARQEATTDCTDTHSAIGEWLLKARDVLLPHLGRSWSAAWVPAGFVNHSTAVPPYVGDRLNLLGLLSAFFTANPDYEDAAVGVTGTAGKALKTKIESADGIFNLAKTAAAAKMEARAAALEALKGSMRLLIRILDELLARDDPRWATFGLNMPDAGYNFGTGCTGPWLRTRGPGCGPRCAESGVERRAALGAGRKAEGLPRIFRRGCLADSALHSAFAPASNGDPLTAGRIAAFVPVDPPS